MPIEKHNFIKEVVELKPCLSCNCDDMLKIDKYTVGEYSKARPYHIYCSNCGSRGPVAVSEKGAIKRYNTRK